MGKAVCLMSPGHGEHIFATLEMIRELVNRGEEVVYFFREPYRAQIEETGAIFRDMGLKEVLAQAPGPNNPGGTRHSKFGTEMLVYHARLNLNESQGIYQHMLNKVMAEQPDYIIHDSGALWSKQIAKHIGIPGVCTIAFFAYCEAMIEKDPDLLWKYILRLPETSSGSGKAQELRNITNRLVEDLKQSYDDIENFFDIFVAKEKLNLVFTSQYFHILSDIFDDSFKFVGPSFHPQDGPAEFPEEWALAEPLIYIFLRTDTRLQNYVRACLTAFGDSNYQVILSLTDPSIMAGLGEIPGNIRVVKDSFRPELVKKAAVMITNEGCNIVYQVLYHQVPIITIPYAADQSLMAHRIEELGAGIFLAQTPISHADLRNATDRILGDERFRLNSQKISQSFKTAGGFSKAVDEILKLNRKRSS